jgi:hypothetical protein
MPTPTYTPLATVTLGSSATSVSFSSIPSSFRDLVLVFDGTLNENEGLGIRFNDATTGYSDVDMTGTGSSTSSGTNSSSSSINVAYIVVAGRNNVIVQIMDYQATDKHKTILGRANSGSVQAYAGRWASTNAVTKVTFLQVGFATISAGSTLSLYGIAS